MSPDGRSKLPGVAAMQLKDPLRQIVALAAIDQWKSEKLEAETKLQNEKK
ncbi:MAG: hypothetical protein AABM67_08275 [Acidobacteriota bacterium]